MESGNNDSVDGDEPNTDGRIRQVGVSWERLRRAYMVAGRALQSFGGSIAEVAQAYRDTARVMATLNDTAQESEATQRSGGAYRIEVNGIYVSHIGVDTAINGMRAIVIVLQQDVYEGIANCSNRDLSQGSLKELLMEVHDASRGATCWNDTDRLLACLSLDISDQPTLRASPGARFMAKGTRGWYSREIIGGGSAPLAIQPRQVRNRHGISSIAGPVTKESGPKRIINCRR